MFLLFRDPEHLGLRADQLTGDLVDALALQVVSRTVDQIAVGVEVEIAPARVEIAVGELGIGSKAALALIDDEEALAVDRDVGVDARRRKVALARGRRLAVGRDRSGDLPVQGRIRNEIGEGRVDPLEAGRP